MQSFINVTSLCLFANVKWFERVCLYYKVLFHLRQFLPPPYERRLEVFFYANEQLSHTLSLYSKSGRT